VRAAPALTRLAEALLRREPSCGPSRLVAVDGHAGSGKSTFAGLLSEALGGAPVLPLDSLATHDEPFEWTGRLRQQVLEPLHRGAPAHYLPYDWQARRFGSARTLPPAPVVLIEGVGAGRAALRPRLACLLWMELPRAQAWQRGRRRDGPALAAFWDGWTMAEQRHFAADPSRPFADHLVRQSGERAADPQSGDRSSDAQSAGRTAGPQNAGGSGTLRAYEVLPGPGAAHHGDDNATQQHHPQ
jgi:energy-coupling factor transporter ATP-binding protein EcfA2